MFLLRIGRSIKILYRIMSSRHPRLVGLVVFASLVACVCSASPELPTGTPNAAIARSGGESGEGGGSAVQSAETELRLTQADSHFNLGRSAYFKGDYAVARHEFDEAVNILLNSPDSLPDHRVIERRLDEMSDVIYRFDVEKLGAGQTEDEAVVYDKSPIDEISHMTFPVDPKLTPKLQGELHRTASGIPLELSDPVESYVHFFSTEGGRETLLTGFKRAGRYRAMIERVFAEEGVPQELIYLAQAESAFMPRSVSNKQAVGMWQFIGETGASYKLKRTGEADDRLDPEKSTRAAARYLRDLHLRYGDWYLAMAAYNCGAGGVDHAVERTGYADYWELLKRHALPRETSNYVPIILAITIMAKNPDDYGLGDIETDPAIEYDTIRVTAKTNLNLVADATLQPVSTIRDLNPAVLGSSAPEGYDIHVPKGSGDATLASIEAVPAANRAAWRLHHVTANDTLATIAKAYNTPAERIVAVNSVQAANLEEGDTLLIPAEYHSDSAGASARTSRARSHLKGHSSTVRVTRASAQHGAHVAASRRLPAQMLHRKAAVHTASLRR
jgi:membrane-bound lytic murein transglycosylase D